MRIARSVQQADGFKPAAVTIGNFDGVHIGHRHLLEQVVSASRERGLCPTVLTFHPHPARVVAPERAPRLLTTPEQRIELLAQSGIEQVLLLPFTSAIAKLTPQEFVEQIVVNVLHAKVVVVGDNFRFGYKQSGDTAALAQLGQHYGYQTHVAGAVKCRGRVVSSSAVRALIESGNLSLACRFLDRPYALSGQVVRGHGVGSKQTVPTLNLKTSAEVLPMRGVYITRTVDLARPQKWNSITNVGYRPTFGGEELTIETFLLQPLLGETPGTIRVEFLKRIRDERKFDSPEALKAQIFRDVAKAQTYFRRTAVVHTES